MSRTIPTSPSPLPHLAIVISGPLTTIQRDTHRALIIEANKMARRRGLLTTDICIDPSGRTAHFAVFAVAFSTAREERPWCGEVRELEAQLQNMRDGHSLMALEWVVVIYGQGAHTPEHARGSYIHRSTIP